MTNKKELVNTEQQHSTMGYFPVPEELQAMVNRMPADEQEVFVPAYLSLELINHNNVFVLPLLKAYSHEFARYIALTAQAGENTTVEKENGDDVINPLLIQANRHLVKVIDISKMLGLDIKSRSQIMPGPAPEAPIDDGVSEFKNEGRNHK